mmetsp:Transcript_119704/g.335237  ORF Transcript_119704/g.335237 Transcript_119704/m.335237 type:complete len:409 (-) Transcript_119704:189-1415(-)
MAFESLCCERLVEAFPLKLTASCVKQFKSMCSEAVLSRKSSFKRSRRSCNSFKLLFSCWWCETSSCCAWSTVILCSCKAVETGSAMCSRAARCFRQAAHEEVRSIGSSKALIWCFVSDIVPFVWSILPCVSRISASNRLLICWLSWMRSCMRRSDLLAASDATVSQRCINFWLSSRNAFAASSRAVQARFIRSHSCWRCTSFLLLSCSATWCRDIFSLFGDRPDRAEGGGGVRSTTACRLRSVDRRHISSMLRACILCSMSPRTSSKACWSSDTIALLLRTASLSRRCVSLRVAFSSSKAISTLSRTCSRSGLFSRCSKRQQQSWRGTSLSRSAFSTAICELLVLFRDDSSDSALFCSFSSRRYEFLTFCAMLLWRESYMLRLSATVQSCVRQDVSICRCALYCALRA